MRAAFRRQEKRKAVGGGDSRDGGGGGLEEGKTHLSVFKARETQGSLKPEGIEQIRMLGKNQQKGKGRKGIKIKKKDAEGECWSAGDFSKAIGGKRSPFANRKKGQGKGREEMS